MSAEGAIKQLLATTSPERLTEIISTLPPGIAASLLNNQAIMAALDPVQQEISLLDMADRLYPNFRVRAHTQYLADRITQAVHDVENGQSRYIGIQMPPRSGKSTVATQITPSWILQRHPEWPIALTSHSSSLATSWGRQVRRWAEDGTLGAHVQVARDAGAAGNWQTTAGGDVLSVSTGESFTGRGAKVLLVDDPHKDFLDAHSATKRNEIWEWWKSVAFNRLEPPVLVIVVQTRWHEDDLLGRLLSPEREGDPAGWEIIHLPAIAELDDLLDRAPGEPLISPIIEETPEQALTRWAETERTVGSYTWAAMYQQRPAPPSGRIIERDWIHYYDRPPETFDQVIQSWDLAFGSTDTSSYVVGQVWGQKGADSYLLDQYRARADFVGTLTAIRSMTAKWPAARLKLIEKKANGPAVLSALRRDVTGLKPINPKGSKEARLQAVTPLFEAGNVHIPRAADWTNDYVEEVVTFPSGAHDDQVDATTQALEQLASPYKPRTVKVG